MKEETIFGLIKGKEREELIQDMSKYQRELFYELETNEEKAKEYSLKDLLFDFDKEFIEKIVKLEIEEYLKENNEENRKNGYTKNIEIVVGERTMLFNRPRLRKESNFDSKILPKRKRFINEIKDYVITLYARNNSVNEIKAILEEMFEIKVSTAVISKMSQTIKEEVMKWRNRELEKCYFTINIDCTYISVRDNKNLVRHKIPIYIAVGTRLDGHKEIVGMYLGNEDEEKNVIDELYKEDIGESKNFWITVFNDIKERGVEKVIYIVSDGLKGIEEAVKEEFKGVRYQRCVVHIVRNLEKVINKKERTEIIKDFKKIYTAENEKLSEESYKEFKEKYKGKKTIIKKVEEYYEYIRPLYKVPANIRKYIYTNNIVESANSKIKRGFYGRGALPNVESAINIIYVNLKDLEEKWKKSKVTNWENIFKEITTVFYEEIKEYI